VKSQIQVEENQPFAFDSRKDATTTEKEGEKKERSEK